MSAKQTAAIFCFEDPDSAVGRSAAQAARLLGARGHLVHIFSRLSMDTIEPGIVTHTIGDAGDDDLIGRVRSFTLRARAAFNSALPADLADPALIGFEWSSIPILQITNAVRKTDVLLCIQTLERQRSDMRNALSLQIEELEVQGIQMARTVLVNGAATLEAARRLVPDFIDKIVRLAPVFPVVNFQRALDAGAIKARFQIGPIDPTLLYVGLLDEDHGSDLLIKAVPWILKKHPQARFIFVGDGPLFWTLRIYARYLHLDHAVRIVGHLEGEALSELIQASDIIVAPSRKATEIWPVLAGWSAGKAIIATQEMSGEVVQHEQNGVLIYPLADSCAWAIDRIFSDPYLWGRIRENGLAKVSNDFGENALAQQLENAVSSL